MSKRLDIVLPKITTVKTIERLEQTVVRDQDIDCIVADEWFSVDHGHAVLGVWGAVEQKTGLRDAGQVLREFCRD